MPLPCLKLHGQFIPICILLLFSSCKNDFYELDDYHSVLKIDTHTHFPRENTALAEKAKEDNFFLLAVNVDSPDNPPLPEQENLALSQIKKFPDGIRFISSFTLKNWDSSEWTNQTIDRLKQSFAKGALGIKLWKNIGMVYKDAAGKFIMVDDPRFDSVINYVIKQNKTVLAHLGEPKNCWLPIEKMTVKNDQNYYRNHPQYHMYLHPDYPTYEQLINARDHLLEKHPDMRFVGAHLGSLEWDVDELAKRFDKFPNMAVDMAARIVHLQHQTISNREKVRKFVIKYQDRLIYGTDFNNASQDLEAAKKNWHKRWLEDWKYFVTDEKMTSSQLNGEFEGLKLPKVVIDKIFRLNAIRWFKIDL